MNGTRFSTDGVPVVRCIVDRSVDRFEFFLSSMLEESSFCRGNALPDWISSLVQNELDVSVFSSYFYAILVLKKNQD